MNPIPQGPAPGPPAGGGPNPPAGGAQPPAAGGTPAPAAGGAPIPGPGGALPPTAGGAPAPAPGGAPAAGGVPAPGGAPAPAAGGVPAPQPVPVPRGAPAPAPLPAPGPAPNPLDALVQALTAALGQTMQHNRLPIPKFTGSSGEDPALFKQKARDYMDDAQIPDAERMTKFCLCLEGDARDWYNDLPVPADWDTLMELFCQRFCIFGQTEEDWHEAWQRLSFDKNTDNIDKFISKVKRLARQLQFRDQSILIKLKQLFPEKADTWLVVHNLDEMCGYLKRLYSPYNLKQVDPASTSNPPAASGSAATPFLNVIQDPYHAQANDCEKSVHFDEESLILQSLDRINDTLSYIGSNRDSCQNRDKRGSRPSKPYKPYITKGRQREFCSRERNRWENGNQRQCRSNFRGRSPTPGRNRTFSPRNRSFSRPRGQKFETEV